MLEGVRAAGRQARSLTHVEHRPWPLPAGSWAVARTLQEVLFAHWRVPAGELRRYVPDGLELELHDGAAWLGIVASRTAALRAHGTLPLPGASSFLELDVRTYVSAPDGRAGIWLVSVDMSSRLAALAARRLYRLPCFHARTTLDRTGGWVEFECTRLGERGKVFAGRYRTAGDEFQPAPGSLEWQLSERYRLYATDGRGGLHRAELHHEPWTLRPAYAEIELTSIAPLDLRGAPLCHVAARQDVLTWPLERLGSAR